MRDDRSVEGLDLVEIEGGKGLGFMDIAVTS